RRFTGDANNTSSRRYGAYFLTYRPQYYYPRAADVGDTASLVFKTQKGTTITAEVPWTKSGLPYLSGAPLPDLSPATRADNSRQATAVAPWMKTLTALRTYRVKNRQFGSKKFFTGGADLAPVFKMPDEFTQHSGNRRFDTVFSGVFKSGGYRI